MRIVRLDGKAYPLAEVLRLAREQQQAERKAKQLQLFELRDDARPQSQRKAQGRFQEPLLF